MIPLNRLLVAFCLLLSLCLPALAEPAGSSLPAVKRMLTELKMGEAIAEGIKLGLSRDPKGWSKEESEWFAAQMAPEAIVNVVASVYAEYLTSQQAEELQRFFSVSPGKKQWQAMLEYIRTGGQVGPAPFLSTEERRIIRDFETKNANWRFFKEINTVNQRMLAATKQWLNELVDRRLGAYAKRIAELVEKDGADALSRDNRPLAEIAASKSNSVERLIVVVDELMRRRHGITARFSARTKDISMDNLFRPATLTSREEIEKARASLTQFETELGQMLRDGRELGEEFTAAMKVSTSDKAVQDALLRGLERGLARSYERNLRFEENQRRLLSIMRQILTLADERFGTIHERDGRLVFDNDADLTDFQSLAQQLMAEAKIEKQLVQEEETVQADVVKHLREPRSGASADAQSER